MEKPATTSVPINPLIASRWSPRAFDNSKPVSPEQMISLAEAARWAPSSGGEEPWSFIFWNKAAAPDTFLKAFDCLNAWNQVWALNATLLICGFANKYYRRTGEINDKSEFDLGAACENLYLQAFSLGLIAHPMGGFDPGKVSDSFLVRNNFKPVVMIAVGWPGAPVMLPEKLYKTEVGERRRMPLSENFFLGEWGKPIDEKK
ncbi:MAG: putative nitroreductase family protein [Ignavibacteria bacterium]|nr:putative nitroreductase family protein [Ignavibacteria bacterium]